MHGPPTVVIGAVGRVPCCSGGFAGSSLSVQASHSFAESVLCLETQRERAVDVHQRCIREPWRRGVHDGDNGPEVLDEVDTVVRVGDWAVTAGPTPMTSRSAPRATTERCIT